MGFYHCEKADAESIVLRHEGDDDHTIEVHAGAVGASASGSFAPVPSRFNAQAGKRYSVSFYFTELVPEIAPVAEPEAAAAEPVAEAPLQVPQVTEPGQVDQLTGYEVPALQAQPAQEGTEEAPADTGSDQPSEAAAAVSELSSSPDAGGPPAEPVSEAQS